MVLAHIVDIQQIRLESIGCLSFNHLASIISCTVVHFLYTTLHVFIEFYMILLGRCNIEVGFGSQRLSCDSVSTTSLWGTINWQDF